MKTAFVTGVNGQDGSYLTYLLLEKGYVVYGLSRSDKKGTPHKNLNIIRGDVKDSSLIHKLIYEIKPDEVYNLAGQSNVKMSFDIPEETLSSICTGTLNLLEAIKNISPTTKFYQASSSEMYGLNTNIPEFGFSENDKFMPASPYACCKVFAHNLVSNYRKNHGIHASGGILFNHESPLRSDLYVTRKITKAAAKIKLGLQEKLSLGNINSLRDWGFAGDYVEAMWLMLQQRDPDDYVICSGETTSVKTFAQVVFDHAGLGDCMQYIECKDSLMRKNEASCVRGNPTKARNVLDWKPKCSFSQLAKIMYENDFAILARGAINEN
jgi:GDPmannose 4,6-dehydratase